MHKSVIIAATFIGLGAIAAVASDNGQSVLDRTRSQIRKLYDKEHSVTIVSGVPSPDKNPASKNAALKASIGSSASDPLDRSEDPPVVSTRMLGAALDRIEETLFGPRAASDTTR